MASLLSRALTVETRRFSSCCWLRMRIPTRKTRRCASGRCTIDERSGDGVLRISTSSSSTRMQHSQCYTSREDPDFGLSAYVSRAAADLRPQRSRVTKLRTHEIHFAEPTFMRERTRLALKCALTLK
eukprot:1521729-Pleurochrysis_carterae.AAC.2